MALRVEWRTRGEINDTILVVDNDHNTVSQALEADPALLRVFLTDIGDLDTQRQGQSVDDAKRNPEAWGELVMARSTTGEVIIMDPELYWDGIYMWFRSRGVDPHTMHRSSD